LDRVRLSTFFRSAEHKKMAANGSSVVGESALLKP
jgi:hypothetical protein